MNSAPTMNISVVLVIDKPKKIESSLSTSSCCKSVSPLIPSSIADVVSYTPSPFVSVSGFLSSAIRSEFFMSYWFSLPLSGGFQSPQLK